MADNQQLTPEGQLKHLLTLDGLPSRILTRDEKAICFDDAGEGTPHLTKRLQMMFIHEYSKRQKYGIKRQFRYMTDKDFYHLVTLEDGQKDSNSIIRVFQDFRSVKQPAI